jgi:hypothetical protein
MRRPALAGCCGNCTGNRLALIFSARPFGLNYAETAQRAVEVEFPTANFGTISMRIMHPIDCIRSRVCNVSQDGGLGRESGHALRQLRASIAFTRAFLDDQLEQGDGSSTDLREVTDCNEALLMFCYFNRHAKAVYLRHGIDPLDAITLDPRLPAKFLSIRYPRFKAKLQARRERYAKLRTSI